jgi:hypothetical protein
MSMMFFHFLKIIFDIITSKRSKKYKPQPILVKKKLKFYQMQVQPQSQTCSKSEEEHMYVSCLITKAKVILGKLKEKRN